MTSSHVTNLSATTRRKAGSRLGLSRRSSDGPTSGSALTPIDEPALRPIDGPTLRPINGPTLRPIDGLTHMPIDGPMLRPIGGPALRSTKSGSLPIGQTERTDPQNPLERVKAGMTSSLALA